MKRSKKLPITVRSAKNKAVRQQKRLAEHIARVLDVPKEKVGQGDDCLIKPKRMGETGVDVHIDQSIRHLFPFATECKDTEAWNLPGAIRQVKKYLGDGYLDWLVFIRKKEFKKDLVVVEADLFFELYKRANHK